MLFRKLPLNAITALTLVIGLISCGGVDFNFIFNYCLKLLRSRNGQF